MIKIARKQSTDPIQEKLRQDKDSWNKDVSAFIDDVKHFKKLINGYACKFHTDKSKINDPIPSDPSTIIGSLANDFNELSQRCSKIIDFQLEYSKNRKKKQQLKALNLSAVDKLNNIASSQTNLVSYGSNAISRFFSRILNTSFGGSEASRIKKYRMTMLTSCVNISNNLEKLIRTITLSSPESIFISSQILTKIIDEFSFLNKGFETFIGNINELSNKKDQIILDKDTINPEDALENKKHIEILDDPENKRKGKIKSKIKKDLPIDDLSDESKAVSNIISDYRNNVGNFLDFNFKKLNLLVMNFVNSDINIKNKIAGDLLAAYNQLLFDINSHYGTSEKSLKEIFEAINKNNNIEVTAQNFLSKYFGKLRHQMSLSDKTSAIRLDIRKIAESCKEDVDKIMNILEKNMDVKELTLLFSNLNKSLFNILQYQSALSSTVRGKNFNKPFMNILDDRSILDYDLELSEKQKNNLRKNIEQKDVRDLARLYKLQ